MPDTDLCSGLESVPPVFISIDYSNLGFCQHAGPYRKEGSAVRAVQVLYSARDRDSLEGHLSDPSHIPATWGPNVYLK